jgi:hypothetical protein
MSEIAAALAKAKAQAVQDGLGEAARAQRDAAQRRLEHKRRWFWGVLGGVVLLAGLGLSLLQLSAGTKPEERIEAAAAKPAAVAQIVAEPVAQEAGNASGPTPRAGIQAVVDQLSFTAVIPGASPRLMYEGRVVNVGEGLAGELIFQGMEGEVLIFKDRFGAEYRRKK